MSYGEYGRSNAYRKDEDYYLDQEIRELNNTLDGVERKHERPSWWFDDEEPLWIMGIAAITATILWIVPVLAPILATLAVVAVPVAGFGKNLWESRQRKFKMHQLERKIAAKKDDKLQRQIKRQWEEARGWQKANQDAAAKRVAPPPVA